MVKIGKAQLQPARCATTRLAFQISGSSEALERALGVSSSAQVHHVEQEKRRRRQSPHATLRTPAIVLSRRIDERKNASAATEERLARNEEPRNPMAQKNPA